jgi:hypothetical protein
LPNKFIFHGKMAYTNTMMMMIQGSAGWQPWNLNKSTCFGKFVLWSMYWGLDPEWSVTAKSGGWPLSVPAVLPSSGVSMAEFGFLVIKIFRAIRRSNRQTWYNIVAPGTCTHWYYHL